MAYRGKHPYRINSLSSVRAYPGAMLVSTNAGEWFLIKGRENTAPLKPGEAPRMGHDVRCFNRWAWASGAPQGKIIHCTEKRTAKGVLVWHDGGERFGVKLFQSGPDAFTVQYGFQHREGLTYEGAARELGVAIMHGAECSIWPKH